MCFQFAVHKHHMIKYYNSSQHKFTVTINIWKGSDISPCIILVMWKILKKNVIACNKGQRYVLTKLLRAGMHLFSIYYSYDLTANMIL